MTQSGYLHAPKMNTALASAGSRAKGVDGRVGAEEALERRYRATSPTPAVALGVPRPG